MRVLITGVAGFVGSHLAERLTRERGVELFGVIHRHAWRVQHLGRQLQLHTGDLRNSLWVNDLIGDVQPDYLLHLAAWSDVGGSWRQPWAAYELNILGQLNLLEALRRSQPDCRVLVVASNEVYGLIQPQDLPIDEETPFRPNSPYGVSKVAQDLMGLQYWQNYALPVVRVRSFNHIGPGQAVDFAASAFACQIAQIEAGLAEPVVQVGNLEAERDFSDVRDVVDAYWLAVTRGDPGAVYNVGSGRSYAVRWLLDSLLALSHVPIRIEVDAARMRPSDVALSVCDNRRLVAATGWRPRYELATTLADLLNWWRSQNRTELAQAVGR